MNLQCSDVNYFINIFEYLKKSYLQNVEMNRVQITGRRIVDMDFVIRQTEELHYHAETCNSKMIFEKETKLGLRSIFYFRCTKCGETQSV